MENMNMLILSPIHYHRIRHLIQNIDFNTYFAQVVSQKKVRGTIYINDLANPSACLIFHPYGMLLLCGQNDKADFNAEFTEFLLHTSYPRPLWLQVYPSDWSNLLKLLLGHKLVKYPQKSDHFKAEREFRKLNQKKVIECTRVNLVLNRNKYLASRKLEIPQGLRIVRVDQQLFQNILGTVVPKYFWDSDEDFVKRGVGFSLLEGEVLLSTCFSAFVIGNHFEIGIETNPQYRRKGHAELAARAYIDFCLAQGFEPLWSCRKENLGSYRLAQKLGFEVKQESPYYGLVNNNNLCLSSQPNLSTGNF
jgi:GNAT superfamily N-acetyltransferase